jgi:hypothetical protein
MLKEILKTRMTKEKMILISSLVTCFMFSDLRASSSNSFLSISGSMQEYVSLSVKAKYDYSDLDSNVIEIPIATIFETSNSNDGYLVKARSANNSKIIDQSTNTEIPYLLKYGNGKQISLENTDQTIKEQAVGGVQVSTERELKISFKDNSAKQLISGLFKDVITFTIEGR